MNDSKTPLVSIIVPAHNCEHDLGYMLDCLVYQTLNNIEIIVVENGSTDKTLETANKYKQLFPEKIVVVSVEWGNLGNARTVGHNTARADYIYSCDSDDLLEYWAVETLYNKAIEGDYDIVCAPYWEYIDGERFNIQIQSSELIPVDEFLLNCPTNFCNMLIRKSLIKKAGDVQSCVFEDIAYISPMVSLAERIGHISEPIYHYFRREGSLSSTALSPKLADTLTAEKLAIENCNDAHRDAVIGKMALRILFNIKTRWFMLDKLILHVKELWPIIQNSLYIPRYPWTMQQLEKYANLPDAPMPCIVYVNGFAGEPDPSFIEHIRENAFQGLQDIVYLNEELCDINENDTVHAAYDAGNMEFVGHYFALKKIYETGGIYLDSRIEIHAPFNYMRYWNAFFGFIDEYTFSDWVFGGRSGNEACKFLLETYTSDGGYKETFLPLRDRIRNILISVFNVQECKTELFNYRDGLAVFSPKVLTAKTTQLSGPRPELHICSHLFSEFAEDSDYMVIKRDTLIWFAKNGESSANTSKINRLEKRIVELESSSSWQLTAPLRNFSTSRFGYILKLLFHKLKRNQNKKGREKG